MKKIENQIRQQLENREIPVSENAWDKLSGMMENDERTLSGAETAKKQLKNWWMYAAASIVILISLFVLNPFEKAENAEIQIVNSETKLPEETTETVEPEMEEHKTEIVHFETKPNQINSVSQKVKPEFNSIQKEEIVVREKMKVASHTIEKPEISLPEIKSDMPETEMSQIASNEMKEIKPEPEMLPADRKEKKNKYVDAGMLLYSVENNQTISESKDNTKLVIIDFNK